MKPQPWMALNQTNILCGVDIETLMLWDFYMETVIICDFDMKTMILFEFYTVDWDMVWILYLRMWYFIRQDRTQKDATSIYIINELDIIEKTHFREHKSKQLLEIENLTSGETSINVIYEFDAVEKLTSGDMKVCNFYFYNIWDWHNRKTHFRGRKSMQLLFILYISLMQ